MQGFTRLFRPYRVVIRHGDTVDEARKNIAEALELHIESMIEDGEEIPIEKEPYFVTRLSIPIAA